MRNSVAFTEDMPFPKTVEISSRPDLWMIAFFALKIVSSTFFASAETNKGDAAAISSGRFIETAIPFALPFVGLNEN